MPAKSAGSEDKRSVLPRGSVLQQNVTKLAAIATRSIDVQTEDPARRGISPVGLADAHGSHFHSHPNDGPSG